MAIVSEISNSIYSYYLTEIWPIINVTLISMQLPNSWSQLREVVEKVSSPYTYQIQNYINDFVQNYQISNFELILLSILSYIIAKRIFSIFFQKNQRNYRDTTDLTYGFFEGLKVNGVAKLFQFGYKHVWFIRNEVNKKLQKAKNEYAVEASKPFYEQCFELPQKPMPIKKIQERLTKFYQGDEKLSGHGNISGTRYCNSDFEEQMKDFVKEYIFHNPTHASQFPGSRQMEAEVQQLTCKLYGHESSCAITTQGGTESIMVAMVAHRNYYQEKKNINKPNIVMPISAHVAFNKACFYYNIDPIIVPLNEDGTVCLKSVRKAINKNTICIVGSNPSYAAGIQDDIPALGQIALKHDVGLHVDSCLGSFIVPYLTELGAKTIKPFNFKVPGVTSISCDHHKYGMSPKGISLCMFKDNEVRKSAYFAYSEWCGGLYATAQPAGSRSSAPIAGAWFAMMYHGNEGYKKNAKKLYDACLLIKKEIDENIPQLSYIGNPETQVIAFTWKDKNEIVGGQKVSIYCLETEMTLKGWHLAGVQKPNGVHVALTEPFVNNIDKFIKDLKQSVQNLVKDPLMHAKSTGGSVGLYGASGQVPDKMTRGKVLIEIIDTLTQLRKE